MEQRWCHRRVPLPVPMTACLHRPVVACVLRPESSSLEIQADFDWFPEGVQVQRPHRRSCRDPKTNTATEEVKGGEPLVKAFHWPQGNPLLFCCFFLSVFLAPASSQSHTAHIHSRLRPTIVCHSSCQHDPHQVNRPLKCFFRSRMLSRCVNRCIITLHQASLASLLCWGGKRSLSLHCPMLFWASGPALMLIPRFADRFSPFFFPLLSVRLYQAYFLWHGHRNRRFSQGQSGYSSEEQEPYRCSCSDRLLSMSLFSSPPPLPVSLWASINRSPCGTEVFATHDLHFEQYLFTPLCWAPPVKREGGPNKQVGLEYNQVFSRYMRPRSVLRVDKSEQIKNQRRLLQKCVLHAVQHYI